MPADPRLATAIERLDAANRDDPQRQVHAGTEWPRELLFATQVAAWIARLDDAPSVALQLAARGHTVRRWHIPRERFPMDTAGYHQWRRALAQFHADTTAEILGAVGYDPATIARVSDLIRRTNPKDPEAQTLEDADCLAFLELKLHDYLEAWDDDKMLRILVGTLRKMTPTARERAMHLPLGAEERAWLSKASAALHD